MDDYSFSPEERARLSERLIKINLLGHVVCRTRKREVFENRVERKVECLPVPMSEPEEQFYELVSDAIISYAEHNPGMAGFLLASPQRQMSSSIASACQYWLRKGQSTEEDSQDAWEDTGVEVRGGGAPGSLLAHVYQWINGNCDFKELKHADSKYQELLGILSDYLDAYPAEKVIVFSYFRNTLHYLQSRLSEDGISSMVVKGGDDKQALIDRMDAG